MSTLLRWHLGLGDAILCNGLVRELCKQHKHITLPCWPHNQASIEAMFSDLPVAVVPIKSGQENHLNPIDFDLIEVELGLGHYGKGKLFRSWRAGWDRVFYEQAGIDHECRWSSFALPFEIPLNPPKIDRFVHDDPGRGYTIKMHGVRPAKEASIFDQLPLLAGASEIHCISSCFAILAEHLELSGRLFLHHYARKEPLPTLRKSWAILG